MSEDAYLRDLEEELDAHQRLPFAHQDSRLMRQLRERIQWAKEANS